MIVLSVAAFPGAGKPARMHFLLQSDELVFALESAGSYGHLTACLI